MKKKIADRWVKALRSGKYKQGTKYLNRLNTFCCLGVLCDLATKSKSSKVKCNLYNSTLFYDSEPSYLPKTVQDWSGVNSMDGSFIIKDKLISLTKLNDNGKSFNKIADIIEKHYKDI